MKRTPALAALALATALTAATWGSGEAALGAGPSTHRPAAPDRGGPGKWTKVSTGTVGITFLPSLVRSGNGDLHLVYARDTGGSTTLGHTALHTNGQVYLQNTILTPSWVTMDPAPVVVNGAGDLRVVFGGDLDLGAGFWSDGRMYTATSDSTGANWGLPAKAVGQSHQAYGSYGTAATTLADGTPIAGFPLGSVLTWHVGTASNPDQTYDVGPTHCCIYNAAMVRDGSKVYVAWYQNDDSTAGNGTFVKQIYPTIGPTLKAPGSSKGANSLPAGRVALAARDGGGVYAAYCVGYPSCTSVRVWKVGTNKTTDVPHSKFVTTISLSPSPSGRLWVAWSDNIPKVRAVRTGKSGLAVGAVQTAGLPKGKSAVYSLAVDGTRGRGDIVVNVGDSFWHTQVLAGLTLHATPSKWNHGSRRKVTFAVTDAHQAVKGAKVKVGSNRCTTTRHGTCSITFPASFGKGKHTARASKSGYVAATTGLKVR